MKEQIKAEAFEQVSKQEKERGEGGQKRKQRQPLKPLRGQLYTYRLAGIQGVSELRIDVGFGVFLNQKLAGVDKARAGQKVRLRGIDAPELSTAEGVRVKDFVEEALGEVSFVGVTTTKPDKYDRYLADVFYLAGEEDLNVVLENGTFLNWELYQAGLVKRFEE